MSNPRKILVLHGYTQNATLFQRWISPIEAACADDNMEFVFVDGPVLLRQEDIWPGYTPPPDLPLNVKVPETQDDPALIPKAWWRTYPDVNETTGIERTITKLRDTLQNDHFEGVLGFSQGSTLAVMLCALLEKPDIYPHFLVDGKAPHPPLKFCVAVTGYLPECPFLTSLFSSPSKTPTLHIRGRADDLSPESVQQALVDVSSVNRKYVSHGKGEGSFLTLLAADLIPVQHTSCLQNPAGLSSSANTSTTLPGHT
ncbi:hypothetical protein OE88DRAFT_402128 [Heliocybe sulcata]|uniref:Serine hydrolase domain-containing protein n=1 Tax=Heliocybe sulcata TaxID=5364 RepID=A0A5C3MW61_9AGAM|nr:hypothetical protein OE88DRAFT_402128 [Heliocybe sulcata]